VTPGIRGRAARAALAVAFLAAVGLSFSAGSAYERRAENAREAEIAAGLRLSDDPSERPEGMTGAPADIGRQFDTFWEAWNFVEKEYVRQPVERQRLIQGAIKGMLAALNDQYAAYLDPASARIDKANQDGLLDGIGTHLELRERKHVILAPVEDGPAWKAGLRTGDVLLRVDGRDVGTLSLAEAVTALRGPAGTKVRLVVQKSDEPEAPPMELEVIRARIELETVSSKVPAEGIGYVRVRVFGSQTLLQLQRALRDMRARRVRGLIVDLRDNPGGYLSGAVDVSSQFLREGSVVLYEEREGKRKPTVAKPGGLATDLTLAVLVNRGSASSSEIVAGALRDHNRGVLIGETTYGKGTIQVPFDLTDGSSVKVTAGGWLTPAGRTVEGVGLTPTIDVKTTLDDERNKRDPVLDKALEWFRAVPTPIPTPAGAAGTPLPGTSQSPPAAG
jgi:carboxyl-terminal processing protease